MEGGTSEQSQSTSHSSHQLSLLDLQVAGLQGCAYTLGPKSDGATGNQTQISCLRGRLNYWYDQYIFISLCWSSCYNEFVLRPLRLKGIILKWKTILFDNLDFMFDISTCKDLVYPPPSICPGGGEEGAVFKWEFYTLGNKMHLL